MTQFQILINENNKPGILIMKKIIVLLTCIFISSCTTAMKPGANFESDIKKVDFKNYKIGLEHSAYVGEQIIVRKSYKAIVRNDMYEAQNDFSLTGGLGSTVINLNAYTGDTFRIAGYNEINNPVLNIPGSIFMFGVNNQGKWDGTVMSPSFWTSPIGSGRQYKILPTDTTFKPVSKTIPTSDYGYINHEIIFTGTTKDSITLLYREYTFENLSRPDFKQDIIYPIDTKKIRFRNYQIDVKSVDSSQIIYIVRTE